MPCVVARGWCSSHRACWGDHSNTRAVVLHAFYQERSACHRISDIISSFCWGGSACKWLWPIWVHQNRASPFASGFYRRRGYRRLGEFRSKDHFSRFHRRRNRGSLANLLAEEIAHLGASKVARFFPGAVKIAAAAAENRAILVHSAANATFAFSPLPLGLAICPDLCRGLSSRPHGWDLLN